MGVAEWLGIAALTLPFPAWVIAELRRHDGRLIKVEINQAAFLQSMASTALEINHVSSKIDDLNSALHDHALQDARAEATLNQLNDEFKSRRSVVDEILTEVRKLKDK